MEPVVILDSTVASIVPSLEEAMDRQYFISPTIFWALVLCCQILSPGAAFTVGVGIVVSIRVNKNRPSVARLVSFFNSCSCGSLICLILYSRSCCGYACNFTLML